MRKLSVFIMFMFFTYCAAGFYKQISFDVNLEQVERPEEAKKRFGEVITTKVDSLGKKYLYFEDELIKVSFFFGHTRIKLFLENKSEHTIKIPWDNAAWIDPNGETVRIIHSGVRLADKNAPQVPSIVVRKRKFSDTIIPADNVYFKSGEYGGWRYLPLFHNTTEVYYPIVWTVFRTS